MHVERIQCKLRQPSYLDDSAKKNEMYINLKITWSQIELYLKIEKKHDRKIFPCIWCELVRGISVIYFCVDLKI